MNVIKKCRYGLVCYNTNDVWIGKSLTEYGEFSEGEVRIFRYLLKPGNIAFDIGANIGVHTLALAETVGPNGIVMAFEPQRLAYYMLCANIALNNLNNVFCLQNVVSNEDTRINVPELDYKKPQNFGGLELDQSYHNVKNYCSIKTIKLDQYINLPRVDFIKIDVEGMERQVLLGATKLIEKFKPYLYVENDRKEKASLLIQTLRKLNYEIYFHLPTLFNTDNYNKNDRNVFGNTVSTNMLCLHKECSVDISKLPIEKLNHDKKYIVLDAPKEVEERVFNDLKLTTIKDLVCLSEMYSETFLDPDKAMEHLQMAIQLDPNNPSLYQQAAPILTRHLRYKEALDYINICMSKGGMSSDVLISKAIVLSNLERYEESAANYKLALKLDPENPEAHFGLAVDLLMLGEFEEGWKEYQWRFKRKLSSLSQFMATLPKNIPQWDGSSIYNKHLLIFSEQGTGDLIQFLRYIPLIKSSCSPALISICCFQEMQKLLQNVEGINKIICYDESLSFPEDNFEVMVSLMDLPRIFHTTEEGSIPFARRYIEPIKTLNFDLNPEKINIGIAWAGSETHQFDFVRSCHLAHFQNISKLPNVQLYSLQKGCLERNWPNVGKINLLDKAQDVSIIDWTNTLNDFNDTANFIDQLDLIISVDTSVVHLAAALGKPTWLVQTDGWRCWRWLVNRQDSPWYPSLRIFRDKTWSDVFAEVEKELTHYEKTDFNTSKR